VLDNEGLDGVVFPLIVIGRDLSVGGGEAPWLK